MATLSQIRVHGTHTKRVSAGLYRTYAVADSRLSVTLTRRDDLRGWMAAADWDRDLYTDVVATKAHAKLCALEMIEGAACPS